MSEDLPKHQLLLKLGRMTESSNDNEVLIAIRKFNETLRAGGWDWEKLLSGKIKVIGDPFANLSTPRGYSEPTPAPAAPPTAARTAPRPNPQPVFRDLDGIAWSSIHERNAADARIQARRAAAAAKAPTIGSTRSNGFSGNCYCCGTFVDSQKGYIFKPGAKWLIACDPCNKSTAPIPSRAAKPRTTASDIFNSFT